MPFLASLHLREHLGFTNTPDRTREDTVTAGYSAQIRRSEYDTLTATHGDRHQEGEEPMFGNVTLLVLSFIHRRATNLQDKIFGILGLLRAHRFLSVGSSWPEEYAGRNRSLIPAYAASRARRGHQPGHIFGQGAPLRFVAMAGSHEHDEAVGSWHPCWQLIIVVQKAPRNNGSAPEPAFWPAHRG